MLLDPVPTDRGLWSETARWQDDAKWLLAPSFSYGGVYPGELPGWHWGYMAQAIFAWEGAGSHNVVGGRIHYGHFSMQSQEDADQRIDRVAVEAVGSQIVTLSEHVSAVFMVGLGAVVYDKWGERDNVARMLMSGDARLSWKIVPQLHLGTGATYLLSFRLDKKVWPSHSVVIPIVLEWHFGRYGH